MRKQGKPPKLTSAEVVEFLVTGCIDPIQGAEGVTVIAEKEVHMAEAMFLQVGDRMVITVPGTRQMFEGSFQEISFEKEEVGPAGSVET